MKGIAYPNKDIMSKVFGEKLKNKSFDVYGITASRIVSVLPVNLPVVEANEMATDNLYEMEDGSYAMVDYESAFRESSKIKYVNHIARIVKKYGTKIRLRMIVLYTCSARNVNLKLDVGCLQLTIEAGYLADLDVEEILRIITEKINREEALTDTEVMQLIVLPLTQRKKKNQRRLLKKSVDLAKKVRDEEQQVFILAGIITFADKIIDTEFAKQVEEWIMMTKVARLFEEEKLAAVALVTKQLEEEREALRKLEKEKQRTVKKLEREKKKTVKKLEEEKQLMWREADSKCTAMKCILKGCTIQEAAEASGLAVKEVEALLKDDE